MVEFNFSALVIQRVWESALVVPELNKDPWRKDASGNLISRKDYGNAASIHGWGINEGMQALSLAAHQFMLQSVKKVA